MAETYDGGQRVMTSRWFKAGPEAMWRGRIEVVDNHSRIWHRDWPIRSTKVEALNEDVAYCITTKWWVPVDMDLEMDVGL